jgi:ER-bound oxygenase mpaB/B'/Rubber oxygenase, catalytic domain
MTPSISPRRIPARYVNVERARARFGDRVDRLAPYFYRVDPLADAAVEAMDALGFQKGWAMLEQALARGIDTVEGAPEAYRALFAEVDRVPPWVDWAILDRGGELMMRAGVLGGIVLGAKSLVHGYTSPGGNKPLIFSGRLKEQAGRRLNETSRFVQAVCRPGGLRRGADGFQITLKVRLMHAHVRRMILRSGRWDEGRWGAPINQHDMAGTTLLFSLSVLEGLRAFGLKIDAEESESFIHLWRYAGFIIGVDADLVPASEFEARSLAELIRETQGPPDDDSRALVRALLESPKESAKTPDEVRRASVQTRLGEGFVRKLVGDETADALGLPRTPWRHVMRVLRGATLAAERARETVPGARQAFVKAGNRYWDRVVEIGLAGATAEFRPPDRLLFVS